MPVPETEYLYRVVAKRVRDGEWEPIAGGYRRQNVRAYEKLGTARGVRSQWKNDRHNDRYYSDYRIERLPQVWEIVE